MKNTDAFLLRRLEHPKGKGSVDVVLDTDTYNEVDDQYALAYLLHSSVQINLQAVYAAPFFNDKSTGPGDGMEKSFEEIHRILSLCGKTDWQERVFRGAKQYLPDEQTPVDSPAARDLIKKALSHDKDGDPLYVLSIGAITNVASAILLEPSIIERIVVVWLGGHALTWPTNKEFNLVQDIAAARVVFNATVPLVQLPCMGVVSHLTTTEPELACHLKNHSPLGDYLYNITCHEASLYKAGDCWSRVIWDISAVAWLLDESFVASSVLRAPEPSYDDGYIVRPNRPLMRIAHWVNRDAIFSDLFKKLKRSY